MIILETEVTKSWYILNYSCVTKSLISKILVSNKQNS